MSIPQQGNVEALKPPLHYWASSPFLSATARLQLARYHQDHYDWLDAEFANLRGCQSWLASQEGPRESRLLLEYLRVLAPYLQQRGLQAELASWCASGLRASESVEQHPGWVLLLLGEAQNALGRWDEASETFRAAIKMSEQVDPQTHARALLAFGRLQFNQGAYGIAFETMRAAETCLAQIEDDEQLMTIRAEIAAYHLNRGDLDKALSLYLEIDRQHHAGAEEAVQHMQKSLLVRRQLHNQQGEASSLRHLAIVYITMGHLGAAFRYLWQSLLIYHHLGVLSRQRMVSMFQEFLTWTVGGRQWKK